MLKIEGGGRKLELPAQADGNLLELLRGRNFDIPAACGGKGRCGKCKVRITDVETGESYEANSCQVSLANLQGDVEIKLLNSEEIFAGETAFWGAAVNGTEDKQDLGLAIDVGTTTIAVCITELSSGYVIGSYSAINRQRRFGADVITRIEASKTTPLELHQLIVEDLVMGIKELLKKHPVDVKRIKKAAIAGNTCMMSFLLNLDCHLMGQSPFTPPEQLTREQNYAFSEIFPEGLGIDCQVYIPPCVSAYIGADITAGTLLIPEKKYETNALFFDMGTNGEIVLFSKDRVICASAAAGPALEGGNISCGTGGIPGAVHTVRNKGGKFEYLTIGDLTPIGICGSAVIDVVSCLLEMGTINATGKFTDKSLKEGVPICENVSFTPLDVRNVQLSKSAIRAGIECVLEEAGIKDDEVDALYLAGGFGVKIDVPNAVTIGLIPQVLSMRVAALGNSSLGGAVRLLWDTKASEDVKKFRETAYELELGGNAHFSAAFMEYMGF
jgi:uncharacterized 2Fe-2S/4Fe-4S cluster protein (DUF4445 family)